MSTYIISETFDLPKEVAVAAVQDFLGEEGLATVVVRSETEWSSALIEALGLETAEAEKFTHLDTVIGPPLEELVLECTADGATYLDLSEGLLPIEVVPETPVAENPDMENLPEPPPEKTVEEKAAAAKKSASATRKKRDLPKPPPPAPKKPEVPAPTPHEVITYSPKVQKQAQELLENLMPIDPVERERRALWELVQALVSGPDVSTDALWEVARVLREDRNK